VVGNLLPFIAQCVSQSLGINVLVTRVTAERRSCSNVHDARTSDVSSTENIAGETGPSAKPLINDTHDLFFTPHPHMQLQGCVSTATGAADHINLVGQMT
jgi:hypothetical protein